MHRNIEIIINTSELTAGTRGASLGPGAIMTAARRQNNLFFGKYPLHKLPDFNHHLDIETTTPFAKRIIGYTEVFNSVATATSLALKQNSFPLILAGDHGSAAGTIAGIRCADPDKRLGVIWIDAHADMHSPYTTPSGNMHGMPIAISLSEDNRELQRNEPDAYTSTTWESLKNHGGVGPKILAEDLVLVAVRDTEFEEDALIERFGIVNHTVDVLRRIGVQGVVDAIEDQLADCDSIYVSFDVDSMDPEVTSFGTGTPVGNGISPDEARELLTLLARNPKTVCMEFVEVNPCLDNKTNTMAETAFTLIEAVTEALNA
jgi:arginase